MLGDRQAVDLSIVIVSWNVQEKLKACLKSLLAVSRLEPQGGRVCAMGDQTVDVWVVDNASHDGSVQMVREQFPWVHLIASERNLGFTRGNNAALEHCRGRAVMLLNPDTEIGDPDAIVRMLDYLWDHHDVGVVGPRLVYGDGSAQPSRRRFPTFATGLFESTLLNEWWPRNRWAGRYRMADVPTESIQDVDWITGACMLIRRQALDDVSFFDEQFFMYSEELDLCKRIRDMGWRIVFYPDALIIHHEGQSSGQVKAFRHVQFNTSKVLYYRKHHGRCASQVLRLFLLMTYGWRLVVEALKYLLGHKRSMRRDRMVAYCQVLASRLRVTSESKGDTP